MRLGALCAGVGGLELALGHDPTWVAETDPTASHILDQHWPDAPNIGDLTTATPPPADIITAGWPCQPVSTAGQRKGTQDDRWLIDDIVEVVRRSGAHTLYLENVPGLLSANRGHAMAHVCAALASIGFDAEWLTLRASTIGAPHHRNRWFCIATHPDSHPARRHTRTTPREETPHPRRSEPHHLDGSPYGPAITRWEHILGRPAPQPLTDDRLNPVFVEWMMGLPEGWVTNHTTSRAAALRVLGNGVVPQQATTAYQLLKQRINQRGNPVVLPEYHGR